MTEQLQVGFLLPTRDRIVLGDHDVGSLIRLARLAEELGFDSVWAGDSPVTRQRADVLTLLPAVAAVTERITLGTAVLLPALRHPIPLAHQLATIDRIADGRLIAGMGGGFPNPATEAQFEAIGVGFTTRVSRLEESIEVMRRLWTEDAVTFEGRHFRFEDITVAPKPVQQGGPPVWLAGGGERAMRRVGRIADGWLPYPPAWETYAEERAVLPQNVTPALYATVCLDDDPERGRKRLRASIERYYNAPLEVIESIQAMYAGPPEGVREWLSRYVDSGARHVVIRLAVDDHEAALAEFAERVLPLVREGARA